MSAGKRLSTDEPLTEHDIAERLDKAALRVWQIMLDARQIEGLMEQVKHSRYCTNVLGELVEELRRWGVRPSGKDHLAQPGDQVTETPALSTDTRTLIEHDRDLDVVAFLASHGVFAADVGPDHDIDTKA